MVGEKPILSGVALPGKCRNCQRVIYPGNAYFVHTDASADENSRVYIVCSDCEKQQNRRNQQPKPDRKPADKASRAGARSETRTSASGTRAGASAGSNEGKKGNQVTEKELQTVGQITALLNDTGYQMKQGKNGYLFVNSKGHANMNYIAADLETALKYAREIKKGKV